MAREKARFTGGQGYHPVDFTDKELRSKLIAIYQRERGDVQEYLGTPVTRAQIQEFTGGRTLAEKFADDLMDAARPLLYFQQVEEQMVAHRDLMKEIVKLLKLPKDAPEFQKISPGITCLFSGNAKNEPGGIKSQLKKVEKILNSAKFEKQKYDSLRSIKFELFIDYVRDIFTKNGIKFTSADHATATERYTIAINIVYLILQSISGFSYGADSVRKKMSAYIASLPTWLKKE